MQSMKFCSHERIKSNTNVSAQTHTHTYRKRPDRLNIQENIIFSFLFIDFSVFPNNVLFFLLSKCSSLFARDCSSSSTSSMFVTLALFRNTYVCTFIT